MRFVAGGPTWPNGENILAGSRVVLLAMGLAESTPHAAGLRSELQEPHGQRIPPLGDVCPGTVIAHSKALHAVRNDLRAITNYGMAFDKLNRDRSVGLHTTCGVPPGADRGEGTSDGRRNLAVTIGHPSRRPNCWTSPHRYGRHRR